MYLPAGTGTVVLTKTARTTCAVPPGARVTWLFARTRKGPGGATNAARFTVPEKPLVLVMSRKSLSWDP